jgi:hypothetical protein
VGFRAKTPNPWSETKERGTQVVWGESAAHPRTRRLFQR